MLHTQCDPKTKTLNPDLILPVVRAESFCTPFGPFFIEELVIFVEAIFPISDYNLYEH